MFYNSSFGQIWNGTQVALSLVVVLQTNGVTQTVTLPRGIETLLGLYDSGGIQGIRNQWYAFLRVAPSTPAYGRELDDLGKVYCGVTDFPSTGSMIQVQTTKTEASSLTITFIGTDVNGIYLSETLTIPTTSGNTVTTTNTFYTVNEVVNSITAGDLIVTLTAGTLFFARYQAGETYPVYRRYKLNEKENDATVSAICKREYYALVADNDPMDINNVVAIENGLRAYRYEQNADYGHASAAMAQAVGYLNGELARYQAETAEGTVQMEECTSAGRIWNLL